MHGLFAAESVRVAILRTLASRRGIAFVPRGLPTDPYAEVAQWFRDAIDVTTLLRVTGLHEHA